MDLRTDIASPETLLEPRAGSGEAAFDMTLRPRRLSEFVGQAKMRENLGIFIDAAKLRGEPLEHVLLYGSPGLGKTTLAHIIGEELGVRVRTTSGPALERVGDIAAILTNLEKGDILFVDEIHRMNRVIEEVLYPAMEEFALDIVIGKGPSARTVRLDIPRFTLIGATTRLSLLSSPLRDRFGATYHLDLYAADELATIVSRSAGILGADIPGDAAALIASRSRGTPRIANRLLKRVRDFADVRAGGRIDADSTAAALAMLEIDRHGLDPTDRRILETIIVKFSGGPVGLQTLAAATSEEIDTLELVHEPFLLQLGFLDRTPRGRVATRHAYAHLNIPYPGQETLMEL
ncbi:MAG TPA: Holliday junction branch migration DNA helicase RuvB [Candidatus Binatia bacterium]|jgi:Holliday junction DNA helicase RuvB|nr:Holliday junction branch migration DNA helicase RuvB [Candidatus Binatia bacterium]